MGHCKVIERHVVFTNGVIYVRMKAEVVRCELVDLVVSDEGSGRLKWMVQSIAINVVIAVLEGQLRLAGRLFAVEFPRRLVGGGGMMQLAYFVK